MRDLLSGMEDTLRRQMADMQAAFADMDLQRTKEIRRNDSELNQMEMKASEQAMEILARYQPMAEDLRWVTGAFKTAIEYERIGDYLKNFAASVATFVKHDESLKVFPSMAQMTSAVWRQFEDYLSARAADSIDAAIAVWQRDAEIDGLFNALVQKAMKNQQSGDGNVHSLVQIILVANNLERTGDRVKNLVEIFYYQKTGMALNLTLAEDE